ncbi:MAG: Gfo/Idh/MocA family oxidoreductase [Ignavibacteria bacterium]|nr:Gfo/Idh/MocA family oxidoreductase [Ignavibacteria bacterium]
MSKYKVCIIGCGDIGFLFDHGKKTDGALTHFKAFNHSGDFEVSGAAEIKKEIRDIIKREYDIPVFDDYEKMCSDISPDVIVISTNDESHFDILNKVIQYKPKLVFCEKPIALGADEVILISDIYGKAGIPLQINYTRRFLDEFHDLEKVIKEKKIGDIESVTFFYSRGLIHNASHYLDLVNWYIGETEKNLFKVSVKKGLNENDETVSFDITYGNGMEVRFIGLNPTKLTFGEVDFIGTEGRLKINYKSEIEKYRVIPNRLFKGYSSYELYDTRPIQFAKALPNAVANIYDALSKGEALKSPASNSVKIFELISRIKEKKLCQN